MSPPAGSRRPTPVPYTGKADEGDRLATTASSGQRRRDWIVIAAPLLALIVLSYVVATGQATAPFDVPVLQIARGASGPFFEVLRTLTHAGDTAVVNVLALALAIGLTLAGRVRTGVVALGSVGAAAFANSMLKLLFDRARPDPLQALVGAEGASYPSGHAELSATLCGIVAILVVRSMWPRAIRFVVIAALAMLAVLVGASRLYLGVHYPSDVLAAWLLAIAVVAAFAQLTAAPSRDQ